MSEIWKFPIKLDDIRDEPYSISMPIGSTVLSVHEQGEYLCLWALVDPFKANEPKSFAIVGTGLFVSGGGRFIGTAHLYQGKLVLHVFEN